MLTPSYAATIDFKTGTESALDADDTDFWARQWVMFPEDFDVRPVPNSAEIMIFERDGATYINAWVTSGWPQLSGCPDTW